MANFVIYTYEFTPIIEADGENLFPDMEKVDVQYNMEHKLEILAGLISDETSFEMSGSKYGHKILIKKDGVIGMRIANNKHISYEHKFKEHEMENNPSCVVLIDLHENRQKIAIQRKPISFSNPVTVAKILAETLNRLLRPYRLHVDIRPNFYTSQFWSYVEEHLHELKYIQFTFPYPNMAAVADLVGDFYTQVAIETNSEPSMVLNTPPDQMLKIVRGNPIVENSLKACAASGQDIFFGLKGTTRKVRCNVNAAVVETLADNLLKELDSTDLFDTRLGIVKDFLNRLKLYYE